MAQDLQETVFEEPMEQTPPAEPAPGGEVTLERAPTPPAAQPSRKRPRLDLTAEPRKRGKTMFGILLGTLNKAKDEDKERNKSEAARRRMSIDHKLQTKLAQEQTVVRRQDEAKKNRAVAGRKEDDLAIRDTVLRLSHKNKPHLSRFLTTSDTITLLPSSSSSPPPFPLPFSVAPPVPTQTVLYYLPSVLLPAQEAFVKQRQEAVNAQMDQERLMWKEDRRKGVEEVEDLRRRADEISKADISDEVEMEPSHGPDMPSTPPTGVASEPVAEAFPPPKMEEDGDAGEEALEY